MEQNNYPEFIQNFMFEYGSLIIDHFLPEFSEKPAVVVNKIKFDISMTEGINGI